MGREASLEHCSSVKIGVRAESQKYTAMVHRSSSARAKGRVTVNREDVIAAATRVVDRGGIDALSMRAVATALGVGVATLYWHVRDKRELLMLVVEDSVRSVRVAATGPWQERLADLLRQGRAVLRARPALVPAMWTSGWALGDETLRLANDMVGLIAESGTPDHEVADTYFALVSFLFGFVATESMSPNTPSFPETVTDSKRLEAYPHLARHAPAADTAGMDRRFEQGVRQFIRSLAT